MQSIQDSRGGDGSHDGDGERAGYDDRAIFMKVQYLFRVAG